MTRSELIAALAAKFPSLTENDVDLSVHEILCRIRQAIARGERVEIRGFGVFELKYRAPRKARNPKTGEPVLVGAKRIPHFKAGKEMRERVDASLPAEPAAQATLRAA